MGMGMGMADEGSSSPEHSPHVLSHHHDYSTIGDGELLGDETNLRADE